METPLAQLYSEFNYQYARVYSVKSLHKNDYSIIRTLHRVCVCVEESGMRVYVFSPSSRLARAFSREHLRCPGKVKFSPSDNSRIWEKFVLLGITDNYRVLRRTAPSLQIARRSHYRVRHVCVELMRKRRTKKTPLAICILNIYTEEGGV